MGNAELFLWDLASGRIVRTFQGDTGRFGRIWRVAFSPDGRRIASAGGAGTVRLWDPVTGQELVVYTGHQQDYGQGNVYGDVSGLAFSPDGRLLASAGTDWRIILWDTETNASVLHLTGHTGWIKSIAFAPNGRQLASVSTDQTIRIWDVQTGRMIVTFCGHEGAIQDVKFSPDGSFLATVGEDNVVKVWDLEDVVGGVARTLEGHRGWAFRAAYDKSGQRLATAGRGSVRFWESQTGLFLREIFTGVSDGVHGLAFSPDGQSIVVSHEHGNTVERFDAQTGRRILEYVGHRGPVHNVAWSRDGRLIASASADETVRLWNADTGELMRILEKHSGGAFAVSFSPDDRLLASLGWDSTVRLWDVGSGEMIRQFENITQLQ